MSRNSTIAMCQCEASATPFLLVVNVLYYKQMCYEKAIDKSKTDLLLGILSKHYNSSYSSPLPVHCQPCIKDSFDTLLQGPTECNARFHLYSLRMINLQPRICRKTEHESTWLRTTSHPQSRGSYHASSVDQW